MHTSELCDLDRENIPSSSIITIFYGSDDDFLTLPSLHCFPRGFNVHFCLRRGSANIAMMGTIND